MWGHLAYRSIENTIKLHKMENLTPILQSDLPPATTNIKLNHTFYEIEDISVELQKEPCLCNGVYQMWQIIMNLSFWLLHAVVLEV